jgi:hypothetical protein
MGAAGTGLFGAGDAGVEGSFAIVPRSVRLSGDMGGHRVPDKTQSRQSTSPDLVLRHGSC